MQGGTANLGVVYRMNTDGTGYQIIRSFTSSPTDANSPGYSSLIVSGGVIYGMTGGGGSANLGAVFKMNTDGTGFAILHSFTFGTDGYGPLSGLTLIGNTLYGMTYQGGAHGVGTIFKINIDGTGYSHVHDFSGGPTDGANPQGNDLLAVGNTLFASTARGGANSLGALLHVNMDGTGFGLDHSFSGAPGDGSGPVGTPIEFNGNLLGMTAVGGTANDGVTYSYTPIPEPSSLLLLSAAGGVVAWAARRRRLKR
jgi:uncharacterized repeat protein (TIGR03803 family)